MEYYKKVDKSLFRYGAIIPKKYVDTFMHGKKLKSKERREVMLKWKGKKTKFQALIIHARKNNGQTYFGFRWDHNKELLLTLKKEFIQSYLAIESRDYENKIKGKYYKTDLLGGNQEVLIFRSKSPVDIELETFIKITTPYDNIFKRFVEENVFGWLSRPERDYLITKSSRWYNLTDLKKHEDAGYVVYYLIDEHKKEIYIGSAKRLGDRVKENRREIPGWSKFKYEIIHPNYHSLLRQIEFHAIRAFASFFENKGNVSCYSVSQFKLVNKNWPKRI
jgi:hypothetical protein